MNKNKWNEIYKNTKVMIVSVIAILMVNTIALFIGLIDIKFFMGITSIVIVFFAGLLLLVFVFVDMMNNIESENRIKNTLKLISECQNAYMKKYSIEESWDDDYDGWWDDE